MLTRLKLLVSYICLTCLCAGSVSAQNKTITLQGSGDAGSSETISLAADANVSVTVDDTGIVVTLPVNVRVKCYGDETDDGYCLLAVSDGTGNTSNEPLSPLIPAFGSPNAQSSGFTVQVNNYDGNFSWGTSTTAGSVSISSSGLVTVTGLSSDASATVTVTTNRSGYATGTASTTGQSASGSTDNLDGLTPSFGTTSSRTGGFTVQITNYDSAFNWSQSTNRGSVTRSSSGLLTVSGLSAGQSATVTVSTSRSGYNNASGSVTGTASGSTNDSAYCSGRPSNVKCSASVNLDDVYGSNSSYEVVIPANTIVSMPMTLKDIGSANSAVFNLETITDEALLAAPDKVRVWISKTPGGDAYSSSCSAYTAIASFVYKFSQSASNSGCSVPTSGGVFYANFAVSCVLGTTGCESASDQYSYGSSYKFFLLRYIQ